MDSKDAFVRRDRTLLAQHALNLAERATVPGKSWSSSADIEATPEESLRLSLLDVRSQAQAVERALDANDIFGARAANARMKSALTAAERAGKGIAGGRVRGELQSVLGELQTDADALKTAVAGGAHAVRAHLQALEEESMWQAAIEEWPEAAGITKREHRKAFLEERALELLVGDEIWKQIEHLSPAQRKGFIQKLAAKQKAELKKKAQSKRTKQRLRPPVKRRDPQPWIPLDPGPIS